MLHLKSSILHFGDLAWLDFFLVLYDWRAGLQRFDYVLLPTFPNIDLAYMLTAPRKVDFALRIF